MKNVSKVLVLVLVLAAGAANATLIDNFSDGDLSEYTLTKLLDNGAAENNIAFSSAAGNLQASYTGTLSQAEQVAFLRDDYQLAAGQILKVSTVNLDLSAGHAELGLIVAATKTPTALTRTNYVTMNMRNQTTDRLASQWANTTAYVNNVQIDKDYSLVTGLYIKRIDSLNYETGYYNDLGDAVLLRNITVASDTVGNAIGFYSDLRAPGVTFGALDNLQIVPEPMTLSLLGLGGLTLLKRRK